MKLAHYNEYLISNVDTDDVGSHSADYAIMLFPALKG